MQNEIPDKIGCFVKQLSGLVQKVNPELTYDIIQKKDRVGSRHISNRITNRVVHVPLPKGGGEIQAARFGVSLTLLLSGNLQRRGDRSSHAVRMPPRRSQ